MQAAPEPAPRRDAGAALMSAARRPDYTRRRETLFALALVAPALALVFGIYLYPAVFTLALSFARFDMVRLEMGSFVGLRNYAVLFDNPGFVAAIWRTIYFGLLIAVAATAIGFLIALLLNQTFRGRTLLRVVVVLPWAVPPVWRGCYGGRCSTPTSAFSTRCSCAPG